MHVLLIEDDNSLGHAIEAALMRWSHAITWVRDGQLALSALRTYIFDMVLLDLGLPGLDGLTVLKTLRRQSPKLPVLIITARDAVTHRVRGLDAGADGYLCKPFHLDELAARMRALHRRACGQSSNLITVGDLVMDPVQVQARFKSSTLPLSRREFALLNTLAERAGRIVSRDILMHALYGAACDVENNALEVHVSTLRRKLPPGLIRTVRGSGYLLVKAPFE